MSFEQLIAIKEDARAMRREDDARPLVDCPICGERLDENSRGIKNCPFGHYRAGRGATQGNP